MKKVAIFQKSLLTIHPSCDTIRMSKGKSEYQVWEKFLWQSRGSEVPPHRLGKAKKKNVKNLLTNPLKYDTIRVQKRSSKGHLHKSPIPWGVFQFYQQLGLARGLPTSTARCVGEADKNKLELFKKVLDNSPKL